MGDFTVGDIIRGKKDNGYGITNEEMTRGLVISVNNKEMTVKILEHENKGEIDSEYDVDNSKTMFEIIERAFKNKKDLKNGDVVTLRNGDKLIFHDDDFSDLDSENDNNLTCTYDLNDDMTMKDKDYKDSDIVKVERPNRYDIAFIRNETVKEMTVKEICEALGYEIKIKKED